MTLVCTALAAIGLKGLHQNPKGLAFSASVAVRSVGEHAAAPETGRYQIGVDAGLNQMTGRCNLRACLSLGQIAARIGRRCIELQSLQGQVIELGHGSSPEAADTIPVYGIKLPAWRGQASDLFKPVGEGLAFDFMRTQGSKVSCILLTINPFDVVFQAKPDQGSQRQLGAIGYAREHGLAKHRSTQVDPVKACLKLAVDPGLHAVSDAQSVQFDIRLDHAFGDPGALLMRSMALCASAYDHLKLGIKTDFKVTLRAQASKGLPQAASHPKAAGWQHHAGIWAPPKNGLAFAEPGKYPVSVSLDQGGRPQVRTGCQQAGQGVDGAPTAFHRWEGLTWCKKGWWGRYVRRVHGAAQFG